MKLSEIMSIEDWTLVNRIASDYSVEPKLIAAIGWHETHWGRLGAGRYGWHLGYGYWPGSPVAEKYKGLDKQLMGACYQIKRDLKLPITLESLTDFSRNSWKPGNPDAWAKSVWSIYSSLEDDLTAKLSPTGPVSPVPQEQERYVTESSLNGLLARIASVLEQITSILKEGV